MRASNIDGNCGQPARPDWYGALLALSLLVASATCAADAPVLPDWTLDDSAGTVLSYHEDTAGRPSVILFWASWCPYCRELFPYLEQLRREFAPRGVPFLALNVFEDSDPRAYFKQHGIGMRLVLAADLVAEDYGVSGTPAVFVGDGAHRLLYQRRRGEAPEQVAAAIRSALDDVLRDANQQAPR